MTQHYLSPIRAFQNKISYRLSGMAHMPARGKQRGTVLLSYITGPFTRLPYEHFTDPHTNYWECYEIVRLLNERGYSVDIIDTEGLVPIPRKSYAAYIDAGTRFDTRKTSLPVSCPVVAHLTTAAPDFQNAAECRRLAALWARRGAVLSSQRHIEHMPDYSQADLLEGFGNETIRSTYARFGKPITYIPLSVSEEFSFPKEKNFSKASREFLWFGGGGAILKGLDLVVEAFSAMPEYSLHIVGPIVYESEFTACYAKELAMPNITLYPRPKMNVEGHILVEGVPIDVLFDKCIATVYASASDAASGSVLQAAHRGVLPCVTPESGITPSIGGFSLPTDPSVEDIRAAVRAIASTDPVLLAAQAQHVWGYVRSNHTPKSFSVAYARFLDTELLPLMSP